MSNIFHFLTITMITISLALLGCSEDTSQNTNITNTQESQNAGSGHTASHGGAVIPLGDTTIGSFHVMATRDKGLIIAGKDAPIDATITPAQGSGETTVAVRFWIGTKDGIGSMKAKADIENPAEPNRWHTHADVPDPIPTGSQLWVEIETNTGEKITGSFNLNRA